MPATTIVCYSRFLWRDQFETSRHHLMRALSTRYDVLYVEPAPNLGRLLGGVFSSHADIRLEIARPRPEGAVRVCRPARLQFPLEPTVSMRPVYDLLRHAQGRALGRFARGFVPLTGRLVAFNSFYPARALASAAALRPNLFVYHCTDEIAELAHRQSPLAGARLAATEREAVRAADLVLASSQHLADKLKEMNSETYLLENGVDVETFAPALLPGDDPYDVPRKPVVLFVGNVYHGRHEVVDVDLLLELAQSEPGCSLVLLGSIPAASSVAKRLSAEQNVFLLGPRPRLGLAAYLRAADVCIIPYRQGPLTRGIYPLKMNEYLAAGRPVVSTDFSPSVRAFGAIASVVPSGRFVDAVRAILADPCRDALEAVKRRVDFAKTNSWRMRAEMVVRLIEERL